MKDTTHFQYCPKIVLFRSNGQEILLAKRNNEMDYNGVFTFIGGKIETTDKDIVSGLTREKDEEIGSSVRLSICPTVSINILFRKQNGESMIIPHHYANYLSGDIALNPDEYSDFTWVLIEKLESFEPKIANIPAIVKKLARLKDYLNPADFVTI